MATTIKHKYSDTTGNVPSLTAGEIGINRADERLYYTDSSDVEKFKRLEGAETEYFETDIPTPPTVGSILYTKRKGDYILGSIMPDERVLYSPHFAFDRIGILETSSSLTTFSNLGAVPVTAAGTPTARTINPAATNFLDSLKRIGFVSASTSGSTAGYRSTQPSITRGHEAGKGGFYFSIQFGISAINATGNFYCGIRQANNVFNAVEQFQNLTNIMGFAKQTGDSTFCILRNDSGTGVKVDTGITVANNMAFILTIFCEPYGDSLFLEIKELGGTGYFTAEYTTKIPALDVPLNWQLFVSNYNVAQSVAVDFCKLYYETNE